MKFLLIIFIALFSSVSIYASGMFTLSKGQQNRLNAIVKQFKIPTGEYKLTVSASGSKLEILPTTEAQVITKEVEVIREIPVEKIVEKIVEKPLSLCVDLSKYNWIGKINYEDPVYKEMEYYKKRNQILACP